MKIGIFQCDAGGLTPAKRLEKLAQTLQQHASQLDLLVCPELFMSGYAIGSALPDLAEPADGPFAAGISRLANQYGLAILYGYPERDGGQLFNSAACLGPNGKVLANHRKLLLPPGFESDYFCAGKSPSLFGYQGLRCAILICYDAEFPETVRSAAKAGAQAVIVPTALTADWPVVAQKVMPARAFENGIWLAYANHAGMEGSTAYLGQSCIIVPDGHDAARAGSGEELIIATMDAKQVKASQSRLPYLRDAEQLPFA